MNKSKTPVLPLANAVGDFIRYWGFRRIHGQIWTLVYLSPTPLSGVDLSAKLRVSKALVSPALKELEGHGLIRQVKAENSKVKRYAAVPEVFQVIRQVLQEREQQILLKVEAQSEHLARTQRADQVDPARMAQLAQMVRSARLCLDTLLAVDSLEGLLGLAALLGGAE